MIETTLFIGGYYLVQGALRSEWMDDNLVPPMLWTVSTHICEVFPDSWVFTWSSDKCSRRTQFFRNLLRLSTGEFSAMQARFDELLENDQFGFPNVFFSVDIAREFYKQYLKHLPNIKLTSIALPDMYWAKFMEKFTPPENIGGSGVWKKLRQCDPCDTDVPYRGFDILGFGGARFCSFVCNSLETDYRARLGIEFNTNGLIDTYEDAVKATEYTMLDKVGAEPVLWRPWLVSEYPLS